MLTENNQKEINITTLLGTSHNKSDSSICFAIKRHFSVFKFKYCLDLSLHYNFEICTGRLTDIVNQ